MTFADLPQSTQALLMFQFESATKIYLLFLLFLVCFSYVFYFSKQKTETPFLLVGMFRTLFHVLCIVLLVLFPMFTFYLFPQFELSVLLQYMTIMYLVGGIIFSVLFILNIFWFAPMLLLKFGGFNPDSERTDSLMSLLFRFLEGVPFVEKAKNNIVLIDVKNMVRGYKKK